MLLEILLLVLALAIGLFILATRGSFGTTAFVLGAGIIFLTISLLLFVDGLTLPNPIGEITKTVQTTYADINMVEVITDTNYSFNTLTVGTNTSFWLFQQMLFYLGIICVIGGAFIYSRRDT